MPQFDVAFIGLLYPKRQAFLQSLVRHQVPPITCGNVAVNDLGGFAAEESARRLASNYRKIKLFLNLPAMSNMLVSKVYEVMACGTFLLSPMLPEDGDKNMTPFVSGKHLIYNKASNTPILAQKLREWLEKDVERQAIAEAGCREVHEKHSLQQRMSDMLSEMKMVAHSFSKLMPPGLNEAVRQELERVVPASPDQIKAYNELSKG